MKGRADQTVSLYFFFCMQMCKHVEFNWVINLEFPWEGFVKIVSLSFFKGKVDLESVFMLFFCVLSDFFYARSILKEKSGPSSLLSCFLYLSYSHVLQR